MNGLPETAFFPVPIERFSATPFWINPKHHNSLMEAESLLENLFSGFSKQRRPFHNLGIRTKLFTKPFATKVEWQEYEAQVRYIKAERFLDPFSSDLGSARNAILGPAHYKGVGRNQAASRPDWLHSWGGMTSEEALSEIVLERLISEAAPHLSVPILGGFLYDEVDQAFIIRDSNFIRCEQISAALPHKTQSHIYSSLGDFFSGLPSEVWHQRTIDGFASLFELGFFHNSPTLGNITVDGRILDHYSMERFVGSPEANCLRCEIGFGQNVPEGLTTEQLWDYISREPITQARTSLDFVLNQCLITQRSFDHLAVPTLQRDQIEDQLRSRFAFAGKFLVEPSSRPLHFRSLLLQHRNSETTIYRSDYGNIIFESGVSQRKPVIRTMTRLVKFAQHASHESKIDLYQKFLDETFTKFKKDAVDGT
jgi:hypothetical protein